MSHASSAEAERSFSALNRRLKDLAAGSVAQYRKFVLNRWLCTIFIDRPYLVVIDALDMTALVNSS
jgi:hypothetical protein